MPDLSYHAQQSLRGRSDVQCADERWASRLGHYDAANGVHIFIPPLQRLHPRHGRRRAGLTRLHPLTFRYQKPFADGSKPIQYGLIAEEVAEVYPDLVAHSADGQIETVKYQLLDSMLLNEVEGSDPYA